MKTLPKLIERIDDGEIFSLNSDGCTYSLEELKKRFPNALLNEYTFICLMEHNRGHFRILKND